MNDLSKKPNNNPRQFLLPTAPVFFFFLHNINNYKELVLSKEVLFLILIYCFFSLLLSYGLKKIAGLDSPSSVFTGTLVTIFFIFFGTIQDTLSQLKRFSLISNSLFLLLLSIFLSVIIIVWAKKKKASFLTPVKYLTVLFFVLFIIELIQLGINIYKGRTIASLTERMSSTVLSGKKIEHKEKPDIYHIVFDSYTNGPALKQYWGYENEIYPFLASKGFFTIDSAFSNYASTPYSLSSVFNLQYLDGAESYLLSNSSNFYIGQKVFSNNTFFKFLKSNGYDFSLFAQVENEKLMLSLGTLGVTSPATWLRKQTMERIYLNPAIWEKIKNFGRSSGKQPALITQSMESFKDYNKMALAHIFSDCRKTQGQELEKNKPVFSFTHILLPHDPYLYDENGAPVAVPEPGGMNMNGYLAQIKYCNKLIEQISNCLLSDTTRKKIIIIQGDHGYRHYTNAPYSTQFGALSAVFFYNRDYHDLKKTMSHVNTYRIVANTFFDGNLPLLNDSIVIPKQEH
ncbi:MAG: sulfatase-like hydrolase/transferase [Chitinophagaceae bacterium]|nr:sulfatase-like hydrolase/transferase [Chitinophagaceae bacterium]